MTVERNWLDTIHIYPSNMPVYRFKYDGKEYVFEWHPYCGPNLLSKRGDPLANQPDWFLRIALFWHQDGRPMTKGGYADFDKIRKARY